MLMTLKVTHLICDTVLQHALLCRNFIFNFTALLRLSTFLDSEHTAPSSGLKSKLFFILRTQKVYVCICSICDKTRVVKSGYLMSWDKNAICSQSISVMMLLINTANQIVHFWWGEISTVFLFLDVNIWSTKQVHQESHYAVCLNYSYTTLCLQYNLIAKDPGLFFFFLCINKHLCMNPTD